MLQYIFNEHFGYHTTSQMLDNRDSHLAMTAHTFSNNVTE